MTIHVDAPAFPKVTLWSRSRVFAIIQGKADRAAAHTSRHSSHGVSDPSGPAGEDWTRPARLPSSASIWTSSAAICCGSGVRRPARHGAARCTARARAWRALCRAGRAARVSGGGFGWRVRRPRREGRHPGHGLRGHVTRKEEGTKDEHIVHRVRKGQTSCNQSRANRKENLPLWSLAGLSSVGCLCCL